MNLEGQGGVRVDRRQFLRIAGMTGLSLVGAACIPGIGTLPLPDRSHLPETAKAAVDGWVKFVVGGREPIDLRDINIENEADLDKRVAFLKRMRRGNFPDPVIVGLRTVYSDFKSTPTLLLHREMIYPRRGLFQQIAFATVKNERPGFTGEYRPLIMLDKGEEDKDELSLTDYVLVERRVNTGPKVDLVVFASPREDKYPAILYRYTNLVEATINDILLNMRPENFDLASFDLTRNKLDSNPQRINYEPVARRILPMREAISYKTGFKSYWP